MKLSALTATVLLSLGLHAQTHTVPISYTGNWGDNSKIFGPQTFLPNQVLTSKHQIIVTQTQMGGPGTVRHIRDLRIALSTGFVGATCNWMRVKMVHTTSPTFPTTSSFFPSTLAWTTVTDLDNHVFTALPNGAGAPTQWTSLAMNTAGYTYTAGTASNQVHLLIEIEVNRLLTSAQSKSHRQTATNLNSMPVMWSHNGGTPTMGFTGSPSLQFILGTGMAAPCPTCINSVIEFGTGCGSAIPTMTFTQNGAWAPVTTSITSGLPPKIGGYPYAVTLGLDVAAPTYPVQLVPATPCNLYFPILVTTPTPPTNFTDNAGNVTNLPLLAPTPATYGLFDGLPWYAQVFIVDPNQVGTGGGTASPYYRIQLF